MQAGDKVILIAGDSLHDDYPELWDNGHDPHMRVHKLDTVYEPDHPQNREHNYVCEVSNIHYCRGNYNIARRSTLTRDEIFYAPWLQHLEVGAKVDLTKVEDGLWL